MATLCGEESFGTGSNHIREKDGLWAVLMWLNILAKRRVSVAELARDHWRRLWPQLLHPPRLRRGRPRRRQRPDGRAAGATRVACPARRSAAASSRRPTISPITTPSTAPTRKAQGVRIQFEGGARIVYRLSGTGTAGATIRIYIEKYEAPTGDLGQDAQAALADLIALSREVSEVERRTGRKAPSVIT